ncbi:ABC transporter ATP-binding protein [Candidatus Pelagibacter sp.]|nr:ABC transporter ATP-binding protein [Candidatus Pelagibacter sp.]
MKILKKLLLLLSFTEIKKAILLVIAIIVMAIFEMMGVVSIMPFLTVLMNPEFIETNISLNKIYTFSRIIGVETNQQFLFLLASISFVLLIASIILKIFTIYLSVWFISMCNFSFSKRLVEGYLHQPYSWFLNRHSADLGKTILAEVGVVVNKSLYPLLNIIKQTIVAIVLLGLLLIVDPKLTIIVSSILSLAYGFIYLFIRKYIKKIGQDRLDSNKWRFTNLSEAFGAFKEIKISGLESIYISKFSKPAKKLARINAIYGFIKQLPRFALEAIVFGGILILVLFLMTKHGSISNAIPTIGLYALASYRLMPALQEIFISITEMRYSNASLDSMYDDMKNLKSFHNSSDQYQNLNFNNQLSLKNINFSYPNTSKSTLKDLNLKIKSKSKIGIIGKTGSGKTTLIDIILGLLEPQKGTIEVDNIIIDKNNVKSWQKMIGYVPQHIFLTDDTIASNIALGTETNLINRKKIEKVSKIVNLHEFITNDLPKKYETTVGERGVRLSGGQRQRIGIARALYRDPKILVLDEATSALDNETEKMVMDSLQNNYKEITIIMIAHRLSTVKNCDNIFQMEKGELKSQVVFDALVKENI